MLSRHLMRLSMALSIAVSVTLVTPCAAERLASTGAPAAAAISKARSAVKSHAPRSRQAKRRAHRKKAGAPAQPPSPVSTATAPVALRTSPLGPLLAVLALMLGLWAVKSRQSGRQATCDRDNALQALQHAEQRIKRLERSDEVQRAGVALEASVAQRDNLQERLRIREAGLRSAETEIAALKSAAVKRRVLSARQQIQALKSARKAGDQVLSTKDVLNGDEQRLARLLQAWADANGVRLLAQVSMGEFLAAIEQDMSPAAEAEDRGVWRLIKPIIGHNGVDYRTSLLWALERLAWSPDRFGRVARILAMLAKRPLNDNLASGPARSLAAMLHPWLPQTSASEDLQVRVLGVLARDHPDIAWTLALEIIDQRLAHGAYNARLRYRAEAIGHGQESRRPNVTRKAFELVLARTNLELSEIEALIGKSPCFDGDDLDKLWTLVEAWGERASDAGRAAVRAEIRRCAFWRLKPKRRRGGVHSDPRARAIYDALQPRDLVERHKWLFATGWVRFEDEEDDEEADYKASQARVALAQAAAIKEIWRDGGFARLTALASSVGSPWSLAHHAVKSLPDLRVVDVTDLLLASTLDDWPLRHEFVCGVLAQLQPADRLDLLREQMSVWEGKGLPRTPLLLAAPADADLWTLVDTMTDEERQAYWRGTTAYVREDPVAVNRLCRELLNVGRARAAFARGELFADALEPELVVDILTNLAFVPGPPEEDAPVSGHDVEDLFDVLDRFPDRVGDKIGQLEFIYCRHLERTKRGLRTLSAAIAEDPELLVQAVAGCYRRDDRVQEAVTEEIAAARAREAEHWRHLLEHCRRGPASDDDGVVDAERFDIWMTKAVQGLEAAGRVKNGLRVIGELVGRTRIEVDGVWPSNALTPVFERWADESFANGLFFGIINRRGARWESEMDGAEERGYAAKFRNWRRRVELDAPRLGAVFEQLARSSEQSAVREEERAALRRAAPD